MSSTPKAIVIGDVDGDGRNDLIAGTTDSVVVLRGEELTAGSAAPLTLVVDVGEHGPLVTVATGDLDGNGRSDIVVAHRTAVTVFRQNPAGSAVPFPGELTIVLDDAAFAERALAVDDVNGDGLDDLVVIERVATVGDTTGLVFLQTDGVDPPAVGALPLAAPQSLGGLRPLSDSVAIVDINGDSIGDIVVSSTGFGLEVGLGPEEPPSVRFYRGGIGPALGRPAQVVFLEDNATPTSIVVGDLNGDGRGDVVLVGEDKGTVSVFLAR